MIIRDLSNNEKRKFGDLSNEDIFKFDNRLFMKVDNVERYPNSYDFTKGRLTDFSEDTDVFYVPSELILHERGWDKNDK